MSDFLDILAEDSMRMIESGYYYIEADRTLERRGYSLRENILRCKKNPIIAEIKLASPSGNAIARNIDVTYVASAMKKGGAVGLSVLTEPNHFKGSLQNFKLVREKTQMPLLMKDFIINHLQIEAASRIGADAILLIQALFDRNYCDNSLTKMIECAHAHNMEVLLESHSEDEFQKAANSNADLIGINNRDLRTLTVDLHVTEKILKKNRDRSQITVSESGIESLTHLRFLRKAGANAFLVGSAIMSAQSIEKKVRELTEA